MLSANSLFLRGLRGVGDSTWGGIGWLIPSISRRLMTPRVSRRRTADLLTLAAIVAQLSCSSGNAPTPLSPQPLNSEPVAVRLQAGSESANALEEEASAVEVDTALQTQTFSGVVNDHLNRVVRGAGVTFTCPGPPKFKETKWTDT